MTKIHPVHISQWEYFIRGSLVWVTKTKSSKILETGHIAYNEVASLHKNKSSVWAGNRRNEFGNFGFSSCPLRFRTAETVSLQLPSWNATRHPAVATQLQKEVKRAFNSSALLRSPGAAGASAAASTSSANKSSTNLPFPSGPGWKSPTQTSRWREMFQSKK